jgi:hypothetical protein
MSRILAVVTREEPANFQKSPPLLDPKGINPQRVAVSCLTRFPRRRPSGSSTDDRVVVGFPALNQ